MRNILHSLIYLVAAAGLALGARAATATETVRNLNTAFAGESNAANRYQAFAQKADEEGNAQVAKLFRAAARAEQIHRDRHRAAIEKLGGTVSEVKLDPVTVGTTAENLRTALKGESYERDHMYPDFISTAKKENARAALPTLQGALAAEKQHAEFYQRALDELGHNEEVDYYVCPTCGNTVTERPASRCPVCREDGSKFLAIS